MLLENLNTEQKTAATHKNGPLLIVAGAGTGKTTVITQRIAYLVLEGLAKTDEILALTFTEKAAGEMEERVDRILPYGYVDLWVSTFHSFCERILKLHGLEIGLPSDFKLLNTTAQWMLVRKNFDRFLLDYYRPLGNSTKFIHALLTHFSRAKDELILPDEYLQYATNLELNADNAAFVSKHISGFEISDHRDKEIVGSEIARLKEISDAYHTYQQLLLENNALDFGDLLVYTIKLFKDRPLLLRKYQKQFKQVLVDEFQDTNWSQYELIKLLGKPDDNLTVCADDDQSIYKFRGASVSNVLKFKAEYPHATEVFLIKNYRSAQEILDTSYTFIKQNDPNRLEYVLSQDKKTSPGFSKKLVSHSGSGGIIEYIHAHTQHEEAELVAKKIFEILKEHPKEISWGDCAILVRANSMASTFVNTFTKYKIPHQFYASRGLYVKPIILDIMAFLRVLVDQHDSVSLFRIFSMELFRISQHDVGALTHLANKKSWSLYETAKQYAGHIRFSQNTKKNIDHIIALIDRFVSLTRQKPPSEIVLSFLEDSGYLQWISKQDEALAREDMRYLNQFYREIIDFESEAFQTTGGKSIRIFLEYMELCLAAGDQGNLAHDPEEGPDVVKIMTIHAAKGLEFAYVFVVNLVDLRFPTIERKDSILLPDALVKEFLPQGDVHLEEERRLFYVAMTRAKKGLFLTWADDYGGTRKKKPSRFLKELGYNKDTVSKSDVGARLIAPLQPSVKKEIYSTQTKFSFTQLRAFETCPLQYKFGFVYQIPRRGNANTSYGRTVHATLQKFFEMVKERAAHAQQNLFDSSAATQKQIHDLISEDELFKIYDEQWIDDWYESRQEKQKFRKKGKEALKKFYELLKDQVAVPKYLEKKFSFKVGEYTLRGTIDRIDEHSSGVEIIDYKTGTPKSQEKLTPEDKEQLLIYQLVSQEILGEQPEKLTFYYVDSGESISFIGSDKELEKMKEKILTIIHLIYEGRFDPKPSHMCAFCDYKNICEYRQV